MSPRVKRAFRVSRNTKRATARAERGIALLIVVSVLTVIGIMGVAFAFSMYLETQATKQFVATTQARYLAESGVAYGRALLDEDRLGSRADDLTEAWAQVTKGRDADVDNDGVSESRWWPVTDAKTQTVGRFAALITDESGKANLNAAQAEPSVLGPGAINLTTLLERAGVRDPSAAAQAIERYRYGEDQRPGVAGVDDDGDGVIDNVEEYQPLALRGDDRRLESLDELVAIAGLTPDEVHRLSKLATVYSRDVNRVTSTGGARLNVNTATTNELLSVLLDAGVDDPWQAAVNIADYVDPDLDLSRVIKDSQTLSVPDQGPLGTWTWSETPEGHYVSTVPGGTGISWSAAVPTGTFRVLARGLQGIKVGDVTIAGQFRRSVDSGESLGTFPLSGTLTIEVANHEPNGTTCAFRGIDLVLEGSENGGVVRGIEAVRFNELMVEPSIELNVAAAAFDPQVDGIVRIAVPNPDVGALSGNQSFWSTLYQTYTLNFNGIPHTSWTPAGGAPAFVAANALLGLPTGIRNYNGDIARVDVVNCIGPGCNNGSVCADNEHCTFNPQPGKEQFNVYRENLTSTIWDKHENYIISDEGKIADSSAFAGATSGASFKSLLMKWNYQQIVTASEFGGRKIDLAVSPKILIESGLIP